MKITKVSYEYISARDIIFRAARVLCIFALTLMISCSHLKPFPYTEESTLDKRDYRSEDIEQRILFIGDTGELNETRITPTLSALHIEARELLNKTTIVFLGDNIYNNGLPEENANDRKEKEEILQRQLDWFEETEGGARVIMVPGNHDWDDGRANGLQAIKRQSSYVREKYKTVRFLPDITGCPGPTKFDLPVVRIIVLDTHWWLHGHEVEIDGCASSNQKSTRESVGKQAFKKLREFVKSAGKREVIVVTHHPLETHGPHGGFFTWRDHIFPLTNLVRFAYVPLPILGSLYPLIRWNLVKHNQDLNSDAYSTLVDSLKSALRVGNGAKKPLIYAAGHEHSLQILKSDAVNYMVVSGSSAKSSPVSDGTNTIFAHQHVGFIEVDFLKQGEIHLSVIEPDGDKPKVVFSKKIREKPQTSSKP